MKKLTTKIVQAIEISRDVIVQRLSCKFLLEHTEESTLWFIGSDRCIVWEKVLIDNDYNAQMARMNSLPRTAYSNFNYNKTYYSLSHKRRTTSLTKRRKITKINMKGNF